MRSESDATPERSGGDLRFGPFELRPAQRQLLKEGRPVALGARAFDVLNALVERRDRIVPKDELLDAAWPGLVVEENNLQVQISALRKVLGAHAIATVPGRGYRFTFPQTASIARQTSVLAPQRGRHNLPLQLTSLIGRETEAAQLASALASSRLVSVLGVGGIGKTRLALQVASDVLDRFADGARFVDLAPLIDPRLLPRVVATALGIEERRRMAGADLLVRRFADREVLLVLDNCEHLVLETARLCQLLLAGCAALRILVTSREPLRIPGEYGYRLPTLASPDPETVHDAASLLQFPAARLFVERAQAVKPMFQLDATSLAAVASICRHLDGIPLAIELAAARLRSLSVDEVNERLDHRFRVLAQGFRTGLARHQTLRALIDWSYDLLSPREQTLFRRLPPFAGGFTIEAAEHVCSGEGIGEEDVLEILSSLVDKSLVVAEEHESETRYRLLETVREYASDRLREHGEETAVHERHLSWFMALAEQAAARLIGEEQRALLDRLEREHDNLRSALAWATHVGNAMTALRFATALAPFWWMRGYFAEGRRWLAEAAAASPAPTSLRAQAIRAQSGIAWGQGDFVAALALDEESLAIARRMGDRAMIARCLMGIGAWIFAQDHADAKAARANFEESLAMCRELADRSCVAVALNGLGNVSSLLERDFARARREYEEALANFRELHDMHGAACALTGLGDVAIDEGDFTTATALHREALVSESMVGDRRGIGQSLLGLGVVAAARGRFDRAARLWGAAERLREEIDHRLAPAVRRHYEPHVVAARAALGDDAAFDRAWQAGRAMRLPEAVDYALEWEAD
jgi:non-specific serine/threonine protein kinase